MALFCLATAMLAATLAVAIQIMAAGANYRRIEKRVSQQLRSIGILGACNILVHGSIDSTGDAAAPSKSAAKPQWLTPQAPSEYAPPATQKSSEVSP
jgi:hypothetical protein